jgi:hypothetical protein
MESKNSSLKEIGDEILSDMHCDRYAKILYKLSTTNAKEESILPVLTKLDDIDVPSIFAKELDSYENKGWREPNSKISDYFNYGNIIISN